MSKKQPHRPSEILPSLLGCRQEFVLDIMRRGRPFGHKAKFEMADNPSTLRSHLLNADSGASLSFHRRGEAPPSSILPTPHGAWRCRRDRIRGSCRRTSTAAPPCRRDTGCGQTRPSGCRSPDTCKSQALLS